MQPKPSRAPGLRWAHLLFLLVLASTSGCATKAVWEGTYHTADRRQRAILYVAPDSTDLLVAYSDRVAGGRSIGRRVYSLRANAGLPEFSKPAFLPLETTNGLVAVPMVSGAQFVPDAHAGWVAVGYPQDDSFALYRDGQARGECRLPYYREMPHGLQPVLLSLPAAMVDGVGTVVGYTGLAAGTAAATVAPLFMVGR